MEFSFNDFMKRLIAYNVAGQLGSEAFALLAVVAHAQEENGGLPARFTTERLMRLVGLIKFWQLHSVSQLCVKSGWMNEVGSYYRVQVPDHYSEEDARTLVCQMGLDPACVDAQPVG